MAEQISKIKRMEIPEETVQEKNIDDVIKAVSENKEAILKGIDLLDSLEQSGALDMVNALVKHREDALENVMEELNKPQYASTLENLPQLIFLIGKLNVNDLENFSDRLNHGMKEAAAAGPSEQTSYIELIRALKDPEINRSITMLLQFLRGMGKE
ncbi:Uncharacterized conserved protein YjgD, DUF1641 family [Lentibacillus persicus]|uniref:Uncharacterized conserved protein YjgD, DUF1641 family n=1 Tax=Lentibacillus persicus TaxID=640948 RepID=A0A1I1SIJ6_9BACI|nr:DUF1641 domain-containing protein [Lentibacillus persicus]SFD46295.1 Uncharacterized conserved protein YjgD, DUF1641 family [Lentibacillus persicus]